MIVRHHLDKWVVASNAKKKSAHEDIIRILYFMNVRISRIFTSIIEDVNSVFNQDNQDSLQLIFTSISQIQASFFLDDVTMKHVHVLFKNNANRYVETNHFVGIRWDIMK